MTVPAEIHSENDKPDLDKASSSKPDPSKVDAGQAEKASAPTDAGKALATAASSPVNPFLAEAAERIDHAAETPVPPRTLASRILDYSAHAAIIVGLIGFAWTVSDHVVNRPAAPAGSDVLPLASSAAPEKPVAKRDEMSELRQSNQKMRDDIKALRSSIDALRSVVRRDTTPEQVRMLSAGLESVKGNIGAMRNETGSAIAQLNSKVDRLQPGKVRDLSERLVRLERQGTDPTSTGSIPHADTAKVAPKPPTKPVAFASAAAPHASKTDDKPQVIAGWVVRDVYQGVALVESKRGGSLEVVPGVTIPGAGVVKSIERHGNGWTVTTSKGQVAFAAPPPRAASRGAYGRGYGYGAGPYRYGY